jgi:protease I
MPKIGNTKILILATHGFEQSELLKPLEELRAKGAKVDVASPEEGQIRGWDGGDWGAAVPVDVPLSKVSEADYDALVLPGGQINPDLLRVNPQALELIKAFADKGKVIGAICHAPWLLIETGLVKGRSVTSYHSIRTDVENAGGKWTDEPVVSDWGIVTSRKPDDLSHFIAKIVEEVEEGRHQRAA